MLHADDMQWDSEFWPGVKRVPIVMGQGPVESQTVNEALIDALGKENADLCEALESVRADNRIYHDLVSELLATVARLQKETAEAREQLWQWRKEHANGRP